MSRPKRIFFINSQFAGDPRLGDDARPMLSEAEAAVVRGIGGDIAKQIGMEGYAMYFSPCPLSARVAEELVGSFRTLQLERRREELLLRDRCHGAEIAQAHALSAELGRCKELHPEHLEPLTALHDRCALSHAILERDFRRDDFPTNLLIVSHDLPIRFLLMRYLNWSLAEFEDSKPMQAGDCFQLRLGEDLHYLPVAKFPMQTKRSLLTFDI